MKKFLSLFLALVMMTALLPMAMAEETITIIWHTTKEAYDNSVLPIFKGKAQFLVSGLMNANAAVLGASALGWEA